MKIFLFRYDYWKTTKLTALTEHSGSVHFKGILPVGGGVDHGTKVSEVSDIVDVVSGPPQQKVDNCQLQNGKALIYNRDKMRDNPYNFGTVTHILDKRTNLDIVLNLHFAKHLLSSSLNQLLALLCC